MASETNIQKIKALHGAANSLAGFKAEYEAKFLADSRCDKKGYGFGQDNRFSAFGINTSFDSWAGYYGNSSCHTVLSVDRKLVEPFIIKALNKHWEQIFATAAELMREEARGLTDAAQSELKALEELLATTRAA